MEGPTKQSNHLRNFSHFFLFLSDNDIFFEFYNNVNNKGNDNRAPPWLVVTYKIKIIRRDKNIVFEDDEELGGAPFPNIIPK